MSLDKQEALPYCFSKRFLRQSTDNLRERIEEKKHDDKNWWILAMILLEIDGICW